MTHPAFFRPYAVGTASCGALFVLWGYVDSPKTPAHLEAVVTVLSCIVPVLFLVGLLGLRLLCGTRMRVLGWIGLLVASCGSAWGVAGGLTDISPLYAYLGQRGWPPYLNDWSVLVFTGLLIVGLSALGTGTPRYPGMLSFAMGVSGWVYHATDAGPILGGRAIHGGSGLLFGLGWVALGLALWSAERSRIG